MLHEFVNKLRDKLNKEINKLAIATGKGASRDWGEYRAASGRVKGLEDALRFVSETLKETDKDID